MKSLINRKASINRSCSQSLFPFLHQEDSENGDLIILFSAVYIPNTGLALSSQ